MKKLMKIVSVLLLCSFVSFGLHAEDSKKSEQLFASKIKVGVKLADTERYQEAYQVFYDLFKEQKQKNNEKAYLSLFFACKALERMDQPDRAEKLIKQHEKSIPSSMRSDFFALGQELKVSRLALR